MSGPIYTYTPNTPNAIDAMNVTQGLILSNFRAINELMSVNHVPFNTSNDFGKHNLLNLQIQSTDPDVDASDVALYAKDVGSSNPAELVYRYPSNGTIAQLTPVSGTSGGSAAASYGVTDNQGWCQFASGIIFKFGYVVTVTTPASSGFSGIIFPTGTDIPVFTTQLMMASIAFASSSVVAYNFSNVQPATAGFGVTYLYLNVVPAGTPVYYFVIGY